MHKICDSYMAIFKPLPDILLKIGITYIILVRFRRLFYRIIGFFNPSSLEDIGQNVKYVSFAFLQICKEKFMKMLRDKKNSPNGIWMIHHGW